MAKSVTYTKEFFDREYTAREAYGRLWSYARKYRFRIYLGIFCGLLTAGTLLPLFQVIQPALDKVGAQESNVAKVEVADAHERVPPAKVEVSVSKQERKIAKEYGKIKKLAEKLGLQMQDEDEALGAPLLFAILVIVPLAAMARCAFLFLNKYCLSWAALHTVQDVRCAILRHIQKQSMQFHGRIDVGQLMSRATSDPRLVQHIIQQVLQEVAEAPFEIVVSVGFIIWTAVQNHMLPTLVLLVVGFPLFMCPVVLLSRRIRKWAKRALERFSVVGSRIHEVLTCVRVVKAYHTEEFENEKYEKANRSMLKASLRAVRWSLFVTPAVETVGIMLLCAFVVWCFVAKVKLSVIVPMLAPLLLIYRPIKQLSKLQVQLEQCRAALARLFSILDVSMELPEKADAAPKAAFTDRISFEDVSFRYDTAERDAVSHATFEIPRGKVVAVVGGTGSGKSTLSGLLARFYDPREGRVTMDGVDLRDMRISDLRSLVGSVMQETLLFNDTIEANIKYGSPDATREQVVAAAKLANAHDFIMSQPEGYDRMVGEKGFALSGGERQRIAIARAILRNPPILILDEATSALDTVTERLVQDAIDKLMKDRTTFAIAHRLSTIREADLILVMQDGKIVERGTHTELYEADGVYRKLCDMQHTE